MNEGNSTVIRRSAGSPWSLVSIIALICIPVPSLPSTEGEPGEKSSGRVVVVSSSTSERRDF